VYYTITEHSDNITIVKNSDTKIQNTKRWMADRRTV